MPSACVGNIGASPPRCRGVDLHYALKPLPHSVGDRDAARRKARSSISRPTAKWNWCGGSEVAPERCIHTHPIKRDSDIRTALAYGVKRFVIDNPDELRKFVKYRSRSSLLIRVSFPQPGCRVRLVAQIRL